MHYKKDVYMHDQRITAALKWRTPMFDHKAPGMKVDLPATALAFTDLHNDFLSQSGKAYPLIEESLKKIVSRLGCCSRALRSERPLPSAG